MNLNYQLENYMIVSVLIYRHTTPYFKHFMKFQTEDIPLWPYPI